MDSQRLKFHLLSVLASIVFSGAMQGGAKNNPAKLKITAVTARCRNAPRSLLALRPSASATHARISTASDLLARAGDAADRYPGISGIGARTARAMAVFAD